jgi:Rne/Rng family ribonuclease
MTKELFVSSTPHETKVGMVEDDQLAEIYLERENEYTLAGSIYKGRVTRVLPGMQSAFVDIGLERDAFLYVSDFMELQEHDEDVTDVIPVSRGVQDIAHPQPQQHVAAEQPTVQSEPAAQSAGPSFVIESEPFEEEEQEQGEATEQAAAPLDSNNDNGQPQDREERGGWRGRRRRRGRRGNMPESRFAKPEARPESRPAPPERTERPSRPEPRSEYGPPPGYQPMILPGESISKYQRYQQQPPAAPAPVERQATIATPELATPTVAEAFPQDEPIFASPEEVAQHEPEAPAHEDRRPAAYRDEEQARAEASVHAESPVARFERHPEEERFEQSNVAAVFGGDAAERPAGDHEPEEEHGDRPAHESHHAAFAAPGTMEEEEIEEEEADISSYVEELDEDEQFEELEEETQEANGLEHQIAASSESAENGERAENGDHAENGEVAPVEASASEAEGDEEDEEAEVEQAQAEAEALLAAESGGNGATEARAEVRAPSTTAGYQQRTQRQRGWERRGGRRGPGGPRRFRSRREFQSQPAPLISDLLKEGQEILVQIAKEPIGKKGARITSHIALPGRFLVYMPTVNHTGVSRKIASEEERQRLKRIILSERENGHGGFIVRTAAQGAAEEELRADIRFLKGLWNEIKNRAESNKAPALIYHDLNVVERVLRDQVTSDFSQIWVDTEQEYERILRFANRFQPALVRRVKLYTKETPLFEQFGLAEEINKGLKSKVWLKSGGYIVINQTEALVAIDINTGKYVGKTSRLEDTIVKTNVDAIKEIVRQIRLRDLGGIIVIDFIDMDERRNRQKVMQALEEALRADRAPSKVLQFNDFGLVAITRKRVKQSLERTIGTPCPYCTATGYVKSVTTVCNEIYVEMRKISKHLEHSDVMLRVHPEVAKTLKSNNGRWLTEMEELTGKSIIVKSDPAVHQEQFDIN